MRKINQSTIVIFLILFIVPNFVLNVSAALNLYSSIDSNITKTYPLDLLSTREIESHTENGVTSTLYEYTVRISKETILKMIKEDRDTYENIVHISGKATADEWYQRQIEKATNGPDYIEKQILMVKQGEKCITYGIMIYDLNYEPKDPVNIKFWESGTTTNVRNHLINDLAHNWAYPAYGSAMYAAIDDRAHGGPGPYFELYDYQLDYPPGCYFTNRYHIRLFAGTYDTHGQFDYWSIENVHHEHWIWIPPTHIVDSWENAESFVRNDFIGKPFVNGWEFTWEGNGPGYIQGVWSDGYSTGIILDY